MESATIAAGRARVVLPVLNSSKLDTITSSGTYTIPGETGTKEVEVTVYGASGGGGSAYYSTRKSGYILDPVLPHGARGIVLIWPFTGPRGFNGGKAVSFRTIPVGTVLTITIGNAGTGGLFKDLINHLGVGTAGTLTKVEQSGVLIAQSDGGGGGGTSVGPGGGTGDHIFIGDGAQGGEGGEAPPANGSVGRAGWVEIRYS